MKKAIYQDIKAMEVVETGIPQIGPREALLRVKYCTICGTDIRIYNYGHAKIAPADHRVLGHEFVGEIVEVGSHVHHLEPGMRVAVAPNFGCGQCEMCLQGWKHFCSEHTAFGINLDGGFQEYLRIVAPAIEQGNVFQIPGHVSWLEAVLAEPFSCVYNCYEALEIRTGDTVVVMGAGPIGLLHVQLAKLSGAKEVILSEISEERLQEGTAYGADVLVNPAKDDLNSIIRDRNSGKGADVVITACSVPQVQQQALEIAGIHGRINFFGGLPKGKDVVQLSTNLIHYKELKVTGTTSSSNIQFKRALELIASGKISVQKLVGKIYPLDDIAAAFSLINTGKKIAIGFDSSN